MSRFIQSDGASKGHPRVSVGEHNQKPLGNIVGSQVLNEAQALTKRVKLVATQAPPVIGKSWRVLSTPGCSIWHTYGLPPGSFKKFIGADLT